MQAQKVLFNADAYNLTYLSLRKAISANTRTQPYI